MSVLYGHAPSSALYRRFVIGIIAAGTATFAQLYSPQGILPLIAIDLRISASQSSFAVGAATLGVAVGVIPWSRISDRFGRLWVMRVSLISALAIGFLVPIASDFPSIIALRALEGFFLAGLPAVALTAINEELSSKVVGLAAGSFIAGNTFGGLLGRLVAAPAAEIGGWQLGMLSVSSLALVSTVIFLIVMPKPRGFTNIPRSEAPSLVAQLRSNLNTPGVLILLLQAFMLMGGFVAMYNYLAFRLESAPFNLSPTLISFLFFAYLAGTLSAPLVWKFIPKFSATVVLVVSIVVTILGVFITLSDQLLIVLTGLTIMTAGFFAAHSIASGLLVRRAHIGRSQAAALYNVFYYGGSTIIGWLGGVAFIAWGWTGTVLLVAALALTSLIITLIFSYPKVRNR